jgi:hypothetical protein
MTTRLPVLLGTAALVAFASVAAAAAAEPITTKHLTITILAPEPVAPGAPVPLIMEITPRPHVHVYAPGQKDLIPISLKLAPLDAISADPVQLPPPEKLVMKELGETQLVYSRPFRLVQRVRVRKSSARSRDARIIVKGTLKYQACDDTICYAAVSVPVAWTIAVRRDASPVAK